MLHLWFPRDIAAVDSNGRRAAKLQRLGHSRVGYKHLADWSGDSLNGQNAFEFRHRRRVMRTVQYVQNLNLHAALSKPFWLPPLKTGPRPFLRQNSSFHLRSSDSVSVWLSSM